MVLCASCQPMHTQTKSRSPKRSQGPANLAEARVFARKHIEGSIDLLRESDSPPLSQAAAGLADTIQPILATRPLMSSAMAALVRRIDAALDLEPGHGLCDVAMHDIIEDMRGGDFSFVLDGWNLENPAKAQAVLLSIFPQAKGVQA